MPESRWRVPQWFDGGGAPRTRTDPTTPGSRPAPPGPPEGWRDWWKPAQKTRDVNAHLRIPTSGPTVTTTQTGQTGGEWNTGGNDWGWGGGGGWSGGGYTTQPVAIWWDPGLMNWRYGVTF